MESIIELESTLESVIVEVAAVVFETVELLIVEVSAVDVVITD